MSEPTPAVVRAASAFPYHKAEPDAQDALTKALTDPDDSDWLPRTLFVMNAGASGWSAGEALAVWERGTEDLRVHWREVADGLRIMLTGEPL